MNFSSIIALSKKHISAVVSIVVILACCAFSLLKLGEIDVLESQERDLSIEYGRVMKNLKYGNALTEDLASIEVLIEDAESRLFEVKDLAKNYDYFYTLEAKTGVTIAAMRQLSPKPIDARSRQNRKRRKAKYSSIGYDISVVGTFSQVVNFLRSLEGGAAHYNMGKLLIRQGKSKGESSQVEVNIGINMLGRKI
tara:strand:+ start:385 stop:969 length:585 start_codon:yes stop_codon:yes gene_type:complete